MFDKFLDHIYEQSKYCLGFPVNVRNGLDSYDESELSCFLKYVLNNLGDPFSSSRYKLNTFNYEKCIVKFFAKLYNAPPAYWGYVTSCGSEGNLQALSVAKKKFKNKNPILYFSDKSHYSIYNAAELVGIETKVIPALIHHSMDLVRLNNSLDRSRPAIVFANIGTTMAGACDSLGTLKDCLSTIPHYIHVDAALFGLLTPFQDGYASAMLDFKIKGFDSLSVSFHKMLGCPIPCGLFLSREGLVSEDIEYVGTKNSTLLGSRSGLAVLLVWYLLKKLRVKGLKQQTNKCIQTSTYLSEKLHEINWPHWRNYFSNIIMLKSPEELTRNKWQLATEDGWSHVICMPHVNESILDEFVADLIKQQIKGKQGQTGKLVAV